MTYACNYNFILMKYVCRPYYTFVLIYRYRRRGGTVLSIKLCDKPDTLRNMTIELIRKVELINLKLHVKETRSCVK